MKVSQIIKGSLVVAVVAAVGLLIATTQGPSADITSKSPLRITQIAPKAGPLNQKIKITATGLAKTGNTVTLATNGPGSQQIVIAQLTNVVASISTITPSLPVTLSVNFCQAVDAYGCNAYTKEILAADPSGKAIITVTNTITGKSDSKMYTVIDSLLTPSTLPPTPSSVKTPKIESITPATGQLSDEVRLEGQNFGLTGNMLTLTFGKSSDLTVSSITLPAVNATYGKIIKYNYCQLAGLLDSVGDGTTADDCQELQAAMGEKYNISVSYGGSSSEPVTFKLITPSSVPLASPKASPTSAKFLIVLEQSFGPVTKTVTINSPGNKFSADGNYVILSKVTGRIGPLKSATGHSISFNPCDGKTAADCQSLNDQLVGKSLDIRVETAQNLMSKAAHYIVTK